MKITKQWDENGTKYIRGKLIEYNQKNVPDDIHFEFEEVSFILRNDDHDIVGGITGHYAWKCLHINLFWIDESVRGNGFGIQLLKEMENFAVEKECRLIKLDTLSFQAPEFYRKQGYEVFGTLNGYPSEKNSHFYFVKWLK
jgi:ribosomal protein S18 acetylase RimI-like enzyme